MAIPRAGGLPPPLARRPSPRQRPDSSGSNGSGRRSTALGAAGELSAAAPHPGSAAALPAAPARSSQDGPGTDTVQAMLMDLMMPVPGLACDKVDVSTFREVVFTREPAESGDTSAAAPSQQARRRAPPRRLLDLLVDEPANVDTCAVCLADFYHGEKLRALPCNGNHVFHGQCLQRWLSTNPTCPCCREDVRPKPVALDLEVAHQVLRRRLQSGQGSQRSASVGRRPSSHAPPPRAPGGSRIGSSPRAPLPPAPGTVRPRSVGRGLSAGR